MAIRSEPLKTQGLSEPFIGPRSFTLIEKDIFFGRDAETQKIVSLILSNQEILIYAQSGAGKTSIINAKVLPELEMYEMQLLPTARVRGAIEHSNSPSQIKNIYIFNTLQYLDPEIDPKLAGANNLSDFLAKYPRKISSNNREAPRIILFDQFEELFTTYVEGWPNQREEFFQQVRHALATDPLLKVVFLIREEYLAQLEKYCSILPDRLRIRFHLEPLRKRAALSAIEGPLIKFGRAEVATQVAEKVVDDLLKTQVEDVFGSVVETSGEYVEPVYLQVVSQRLWRKGLPADQKSISQTALGNVNEALEEFYADAVKSSAKQTGVKEGNIREWCEKKLITSTGTRGIIHRETSITGGIPNPVIDVLEQKYLVRTERRAGATWYELTHDRLLKPIKDSNNKWRANNRKKRLRVIVPVAAAAVPIFMLLTIFFLVTSPSEPATSILTFSLGPSATSIAINHHTNLVYVGNSFPNSVSVIIGPGNEIVKTIPLATSLAVYPTSISFNPRTNTVYAATTGSTLISVIDGDTNKVISNMSVGIRPSLIAVNPNTDTLYVADSESNVTYAIHVNTSEVISAIPLGGVPKSISFNPHTYTVYAATTGSNSISVIDGINNEVISTISVGSSPSSISINPITNAMYVANTGSNSISVIDSINNKVISTISVGPSPSSVSVNPNTNAVYVANSRSNSISVIDGDTNKVISNMSVGICPSLIAANPNVNTLYVASSVSCNHPPQALDQQVTTETGKPVQIVLGAIDNDTGDSLSAAIVTKPQPDHGSLGEIDQNTGNVTYTPAPSFTGDDSFTFKVTDSHQAKSNIATISISVVNAQGAPPNMPPQINISIEPTNPKSTQEVELKSYIIDEKPASVKLAWHQISGQPPVNLTLSSDNRTASFIAPEVKQNTTFTFKLTATDDKNQTASQDVTVNAQGAPPP